MVEVMKTMVTSFERSHACTATLSAPSPAAGHCQPTPPLETSGPSGKSASVSCGVIGLFSWVLVCTRFFLCPPIVCCPVLCKFWQLCDGVNGDLLLESLCYTQISCTQSPCPCSNPLLTHTSTGDTQTQFCLSLCGVSGSWCRQGLFEASERFWRVWHVTLNAYSPLLPSCWGFSALGRGVSSHSHSHAA